jgi:hypothetical protein
MFPFCANETPVASKDPMPTVEIIKVFMNFLQRPHVDPKHEHGPVFRL